MQGVGDKMRNSEEINGKQQGEGIFMNVVK